MKLSSKHKTNKSDYTCYKCGKEGYFANNFFDNDFK